MLNIDSAGRFFVRTKEFPAFKEIEGQILYIRDVSSGGIRFSFVQDSKPADKEYLLPIEANDDGWHDINGIMAVANTAILPKYSSCQFTSETARSYREHAECQVKSLTEQEAIGQICFVCAPTKDGNKVSKQAYYVIAVDDSGYMITYQGFCQPLKSWEKPRLNQRVLYLGRSGKRLYPAAPIVDWCNAALNEDKQRSENYAKTIYETVAASSADSGMRVPSRAGMRTLHLD